MKRLAAIAAAVGMVVVAVMVRGAMDDDEGDGDDRDAVTVVMCAPDLAEACNALGDTVEVRVEDPAVTAASLDDGSLADDVDAWITSTAWLEIAESRSPEAIGDAEAVVTSSTVVATAPGRFDAIADLCSGDDVWQCLGDGAGTPWAELGGPSSWGDLRVGLADADLAVGLPGIASAAAGFFGSTDFAANDLQAGEFEAWLANLAEPSGDGEDDPALTMATQQGTYSAAGDVSAAADRLDGRGVRSIAPQVPVAATVALVEIEGHGDLPDAGPVSDALQADGWVRANEDDLAPTLKPGVMAALHSLWRAVTS